MRILGIDPGYAIVGYGIVDYDRTRFQTVHYGAVTTQAGLSFPLRLQQIYDEIDLLMKRFRPDAMAIEELFFYQNKTTAIDVAQARGVILLAAQQNGLEIGEYTPMQVKQAVVGYGKAVKSQVMEMTRVLLHLPAIPKPDDTADALAIAICHAHVGGSALNRRIMEGR